MGDGAAAVESSVRAALIVELSRDTACYDIVQQIRQVHDPAFERWMPHINLYYPFLQGARNKVLELEGKLQVAPSAAGEEGEQEERGGWGTAARRVTPFSV